MVRRFVVGAGTLVLAGSVAWGVAALRPGQTSPDGPEPAPPAVGSPSEPTSEPTSEPARQEPRPPLTGPTPGRRVPIRVSRTASGIRCPDGTFLPLLNGVPEAPPIQRSRHLGPVPPVVAILVDQRGDQWYEHADGSATTTRFRRDIVDGVERNNIETVHNARLPDHRGTAVRSDR